MVIIDDDEMILDAMRVILGGRSFKVACYSDPEKGASAAVADGVAAVVVDVRMPVHDGFWVFRQIRAAAPHLPIIFNSAYQDVVVPEEVEALYKPFAYLSKNGNPMELLRTVESAVRGKEPPALQTHHS